MRRVLVVSKPVRPPWTDSSKNLVRDVVAWSERTEFALMGDPVYQPSWPRVRWDPVYRHPGRYAPGILQNARAFGHLLAPGKDVGICHFFFAPNPVTCAALRPLVALTRRPSIHSICSVPRDFSGVRRLMFADIVVALSEWTARRLQEEGVDGVRYIRPGIDPRALSTDPRSDLPDKLRVRGHPVVLFAGDYEVGGGALTLVRSLPALLATVPDARLILACRLKTPESRRLETEVRREAAAVGVSEEVVFLNEVEEMGNLIALSSVVALPASSTYRKMDVPLVLLEALALGKPVLVSNVDPIRETVRYGGGRAIPMHEVGALVAALRDLLTNPEHYRTVSREAVDSVDRFWHVRHCATEYEALYDELWARKGNPWS